VDLLDRLLGHDLHATRVLLERCRALDERQLAQRFDIGPGSVRDTLRHLVGARRRWADRIGGRPLRPPLEDEAGGPRTPDELLATLVADAGDFAAVARAVAAEGRLDEVMELAVPGIAEPFRFTRGTAIVHVATHGVHHRAQVLNMLRRLGVEDLPDLDAVEWELGTRG
jgi:uncharacterized damage-inducible protein DinB